MSEKGDRWLDQQTAGDGPDEYRKAPVQPVYCAICGRRKKPVGRDSMDSGLCDHDCDGYYAPPLPGYLWPREQAE